MHSNNSWSWSVHVLPSGKIDRTRHPLWPHDSDIRSYDSIIQDHTCDNALILGATPGLRDLASEHSKHVTVVDIQSDMIDRTSTLLRQTTSSREEHYVCDWTEMNFDQRFDLVLADIIWWLFPKHVQHKLAHVISNALTPNGLFVSRMYVQYESSDAPGDILSSYTQTAINNPAQKSESYHTAFLHIACINADPITGKMNGVKTAANIEKYAAGLPPEALETYRRKALFWSNGGFPLYFQSEHEIESSLDEYFQLENSVVVSDYAGAESLPVISWRKR